MRSMSRRANSPLRSRRACSCDQETTSFSYVVRAISFIRRQAEQDRLATSRTQARQIPPGRTRTSARDAKGLAAVPDVCGCSAVEGSVGTAAAVARPDAELDLAPVIRSRGARISL